MSDDLLTETQEVLRDELAAAITPHRGGKHAMAMAYELLRRDKRSHQLIGVVEDAERAVFHKSPFGNVVAVPFDESGVDGLDTRQWAKLRERTDIERFVRKQGDEFWDWVHPRYQWVFEISS